MSQALYRKYRPKTFDEVYGQDNIINILKNQIDNNKISHAYLFAGSRGTGKTSCAKIFSRAVNCLNPINGNPCNECANCKAILEESSMDVVEMDAASNRRIDDIRQLRDTVIYPPTDLKYKVYIIDEAHMITNEGFNALLKIMEEPPKHLIFILATTEVDKIPDTILSRTQRFEFKKFDLEIIEDRITDILNKEGIDMDATAITSISTTGKGSMRDALSTLDQVISIDDKDFSLEQINDILGILGDKTKARIYQAAIDSSLSEIIILIDEEIQKGKDSHNIIKEMISFIEMLMDLKLGQNRDGLDSSPEIFEMAEKVDLEYLVNSLDILMDYELKIKKSDNRNLLLKMAMIRLVDNTPRDLLISKIKALEKRIERLESGDLQALSMNVETKAKLDNKKAPSIVNGNPFDSLKKEAKEEDDKLEKEMVEASFEDSNKSQELFKKEEEPVQKEPDYGNIKEHGASSARDKSIEQAIRNYVLKKFPSSKQLYDEVVDFNLSNDQLTYYVNERGYTFSKVMVGLFRETEEAFLRQTKQKIVIRFELRPSVQEDGDNASNSENLDKLKNFFGKDNIEIID